MEILGTSVSSLGTGKENAAPVKIKGADGSESPSHTAEMSGAMFTQARGGVTAPGPQGPP